MIIKREDNKQVIWGYRYRYKINGVWYKKENYHKDWSKRQAQEEEIKFIESLKVKTGDTLMFSELYEMYLDYKQDKLKLRSFKHFKNICENHVLPYFKDYKISEIKTHDVEQWQKTLLKDTYTVDSKKRLYSNIAIHRFQMSFNALLSFAYDRDLIQRNPFKPLDFVKRKTEPKHDEKRFITVTEITRIIQAIELSEKDEIKKAQDLVTFSILFWCGLRKGEVMALDIKDYNILTRELNIYKSYDYSNQIITSTKTHNSIRVVVVPDVVDEYIVRLISLYRRMIDFSTDKSLISYHERIGASSLDRKKDKYCTLAGLNIKLHDLRHSHVSLLINSGLQPFEIAKRLGHSVEMVNEVYGHLYPSKQKEMVDMLNSLN